MLASYQIKPGTIKVRYDCMVIPEAFRSNLKTYQAVLQTSDPTSYRQLRDIYYTLTSGFVPVPGQRLEVLVFPVYFDHECICTLSQTWTKTNYAYVNVGGPRSM